MPNTHDAVKSHIRELEAKRYAAMSGNRWEEFTNLCHPELIYTHSSGETDSRGSYVEKLKTGFYKYRSIDHPIDEIKIFPDVVLVLGAMNADIEANGVPKTLRSKSLSVWKNTTDGWRFLAYHPTPLPAEPTR